MKHVWRIVNIAAIPVGAWTGYSSTAPEKLTHANPDPLFCFVTFVTMALFVVGWFWIASRYCDSFRRPSFDRFPLNIRYDPLQFFFIGSFVLFAQALGASARWPETGTVAFYMVLFHWCLFTGWLIGQLFGYAIYRDRIATA